MSSARGGWWRAALCAGAVLSLVFSSTLMSTDAYAGSEAERAAREIQDARDRANAAAQAMFEAESRIDQLNVDIAAKEAALAQMEANVSSLRDSLSAAAVQRFTQGVNIGNPLFTPVDGMNSQATADVFASAATGRTLASMDDYAAAIDELDHARADLDDQKAEAQAARDSFENLKAQAEAEVIRLQEIEDQRLKDEAVQRELDKLRAAEAEKERQAQEAAAAQAAAQQPQAARASGADNSGAVAAPADSGGVGSDLGAADGGGCSADGGDSPCASTRSHPAPPHLLLRHRRRDPDGLPCDGRRRVLRHVGCAAFGRAPASRRRHDVAVRARRSSPSFRASVNFKTDAARRQLDLAERQRRQPLLLRPPERVRGLEPLGLAGRSDRLRRLDRQRVRTAPPFRGPSRRGRGGRPDPYVRAVC